MCSNFDNVKPAPPDVEVRTYAGQLLSGQLGDIQTIHAWPRREAWIIRFHPDSGDWRFEDWQWSLVPFWSKERAPRMSTFNARSETVQTAPAYRGAWRQAKRCLIPLTGWYESGKPLGRKGFVRIRPQAPAITFAGLYDSWVEPESGQHLNSFTMLTTAAAPSISHVHHRMPVIIPTRYRDAWLAPETTLQTAWRMLHPVEDDYRVDEGG